MRGIKGFLFFSLAPLWGFILAVHMALEPPAMALSLIGVDKGLDAFAAQVASLRQSVGALSSSLLEEQALYEEQNRLLAELAKRSEEQRELSDSVYEERILAKLGPPVAENKSSKAEIKVFELQEIGYRGYMAKVKLFDPAALRVLLGQDTWGKTETTSSAVARAGAIFGINGGGFYSSSRGGQELLIPLGNTVINGKLVEDFQPTQDELFFAGVNTQGRLFGGFYASKEEFWQQKPWQGVSFLPILIKNSKPLALPVQWQRQRHPRTVMAEYANGDLLFIVVDGRQDNWSAGITLEDLQIKLLDLGVVQAYNLDGGGSSAFVFAGKVLNKPSEGRQRPVTTNIVLK